jgi:hypothetical protein
MNNEEAYWTASQKIIIKIKLPAQGKISNVFLVETSH